MTGGRVSAWAVIVVAAVLFVAFNVLSQTVLRNSRIDLTENQLYTLSDGTRTVLGDLSEPLTVRFFYSGSLAGDLPTIRQYGQRVQEMLETYAAQSNDMVTLQVIDPVPFSSDEDEAVAFGLQGVPLNDAGDRLYFGMAATNTTDDIEIIPFFQDQREAFLEYDLTRALFNLANPKRRVVGLISTLPIAGGFDQERGMSQPWAIASQIDQLFELKDLGTALAEIPEDVDVLMVVHPKELPSATRYAIDQYVVAGGNALIFVDPFSEVAAGTPDPKNPARLHNSSLPELFSAWGVELAPGMFVGDRLAARKVRAGTRDRPEAIDYVAWLSLQSGNMSPDEIATGQLGLINVATAGALSATEDATTELIPLLSSSDQAMLIERLLVQFVPDPAGLLSNFQATGTNYAMAARLTGPVKTAFPDGPPEEQSDELAALNLENWEETHVAESDGSVNLILVADSDIIADRQWVQVQQFAGQTYALPSADNGPFVINALDVLAGSSELISLRSRGTSAKPFEVVEALQRDAEDRFRETEEALQSRVAETEQKLADLQSGEATGGALVMSPEQQEAVAAFREELVATRKQLRDVQLALRQDIEQMGLTLKFLNIALVPLAIGLLAIVVSLVRRQRRRRAIRVG